MMLLKPSYYIIIFQDLTSTAGEDVVLAMNTFIKRLLAVSDPDKMKVQYQPDCVYFLESYM